MPEVDLGTTSLRSLNATLHELRPDTNERHWIVDHPAGRHAIAAGLNVPITVEINGKRRSELHVDGGVSASLFLPRTVLPLSLIHI